MKKQDGIKVAKLCAKYVNAETIIRKCENVEQCIAVKKHFERIRLKNRSDLKVKEIIDERLTLKLNKIAQCLPDEGYSMGSYISVRFAGLRGSDDRTSEYARSSKYKTQHGSVHLRLNLDEFKNIKCIGGLATYIYPGQRSRVKKCWWYVGDGKHSRFVLCKQHGFIFNDYHALTKEQALAGGMRILALEKQNEVLKKKLNKAIKMQYSYQDSINAGNCVFGTKAFILKCGLDIEKRYRGSFLLKKAKEKSTSSLSYIDRMIKYKASCI